MNRNVLLECIYSCRNQELVMLSHSKDRATYVINRLQLAFSIAFRKWENRSWTQREEEPLYHAVLYSTEEDSQ